MANDEERDSFWEMVELAASDRPRFLARLDDMASDDLARLCLDYEEAAAALKEEPYVGLMGNPSEDGADDVAYAIVAQGRQVYEEVVDQPHTLPQAMARTDGEPAFDARGAIAKVYRARFGESVFHAMARLAEQDDEP